MTSLKTNFAGLQLCNPVIISSSGLTNSAEKNRRLEAAGAGAIVLKSVFEEQIMRETHHWVTNDLPEGDDYLGTYVRAHTLNNYISLIRESKEACSIPIIASINCYSADEWTEFARIVEEAGADALEVNILSVQTDWDYKYGSFEQMHIDILRQIKKEVSIPVIMKLGMNLTNPIALIHQLCANGADGVVLFNRFYHPDIHLDTLNYSAGEVFSHSGDLANGLRWAALASARVPGVDYAISGGVHSGDSLIKSILAGASAVEICSTIYRHGESVIGEMTARLEEWMTAQGYQHLYQFRGRMNASATGGGGSPYERTQFLKYFSSK